MKYVIWVLCVISGLVAKVVLNNYLPVYLSPDLLLMFVIYITFFYGYYNALLSIVVIAYLYAVFSLGSVWFYIFSYMSVFYFLTVLKRFFSRTQTVAVVTLAVLVTLVYPLTVLISVLLSGKMVFFKTALNTAVMQLPINVVTLYLMFKYFPRIDSKLRMGIMTRKV